MQLPRPPNEPPQPEPTPEPIREPGTEPEPDEPENPGGVNAPQRDR